jgi:antitoxin (DNA-binding transcriptional repressor) of toxin-antitoxin stability system
MLEVSVEELRASLGARARGPHPVLVTFHGVPVAQLIPLNYAQRMDVKNNGSGVLDDQEPLPFDNQVEPPAKRSKSRVNPGG